MIQTKEKEIDGLKVAVSEFPARFGFKMQTRLTMIFGPALGTLLSGLEAKTGSALDGEFNLDKLPGALESLFSRMNEDKAMDLVLEILKSTRIDGVEVTNQSFDLVFAGKYHTMYKVLWFVLEVNYGGFFGEGGIGEALKRLRTIPPKASSPS